MVVTQLHHHTECHDHLASRWTHHAPRSRRAGLPHLSLSLVTRVPSTHMHSPSSLTSLWCVASSMALPRGLTGR